MDHDEIAFVREHSPAWRLLRADSAPLVLAALGQVFIVDNIRTIAESDLLPRVDDVLYAANAAAPLTSRATRARPAPMSQTWAAPEAGWLRSFYPENSNEAHYDATSDLEKAWGVGGGAAAPLVRRHRVASAWRLHGGRGRQRSPSSSRRRFRPRRSPRPGRRAGAATPQAAPRRPRWSRGRSGAAGQ
ncbi:MAG: DUF3375 family protein [Tetrasphaera sp.]